MYTDTHVHRRMCTRTHVHRSMCTWTYMYMCVHVYVYIHVQLHADLRTVHMHTRTPAHTDTAAHTLSVCTPTQHHDPPRQLTEGHWVAHKSQGTGVSDAPRAHTGQGRPHKQGEMRRVGLCSGPMAARILTAPPGLRVSNINLSRPSSRDSFEGSSVVPGRANTQGMVSPLCFSRPGNPGFGGSGAWEAGGGWSGQEEAVGSGLESIRPRPSPRVKPAHS